MSDLTNPETLQEIEQVVGHEFTDRALLVEAFTHTSSADDRLASNERLEFLGDAILGMVVCQALFSRFTRHLEGDLTKIKSLIVSRSSCAKILHQMGLQKHLRVGKGMASSRALPSSLEAGLMEAVIGAVYLDGGLQAAEKFILHYFGPLIRQAEAKGPNGNYKSLLQQYAQEKFGATPAYSLLDEKGPDHNKCFECEVILDQRHFQSAWGVTKKEAEQRAAFNALAELGVIDAAPDPSGQELK